MNKLIGLVLWAGAFIYGMYLSISYFTSGSVSVSALIGIVVLFVLSGIGRRIFWISEDDIDSLGWFGTIFGRINCRRTYWSIVFYASVTAILYGVNLFMKDNLKGILIAAVAFFICVGVRTVMSYTCSHCGAGLFYDDSDYDNDILAEDSSSSREYYRYSTEYYHCNRCGKRSRIRIKNKIGSVKYK